MRYHQIVEGVHHLDPTEDRNYPVRVFENPNAQQMKSIFQSSYNRARVLIDEKGNLFAWSGHQAIHDDVRDSLGVDAVIAGFMYPGEFAMRYMPEDVERLAPDILANKNVIRALGGMPFEVLPTDDD